MGEPWTVRLVDGRTIGPEQISGAPCYVLALSGWDDVSRESLGNLAEVAKEFRKTHGEDEFPTILVVFFDVTPLDLEELRGCLGALPILVGQANSRTAEAWGLEVVPALFLWDGWQLRGMWRGFLETKAIAKLFDAGVRK